MADNRAQPVPLVNVSGQQASQSPVRTQPRAGSVSDRALFAGGNTAANPFAVPLPPVDDRQSQESSEEQGSGSFVNFLSDAGQQARYMAEPQLMGAMEEGVIPHAASQLDRGFSTMLGPISRTLFGPGEEEGQEDQEITEGTAPGGTSSLSRTDAGGSGGAGGSVSTGGGTAGGQAGFTIPLPASADEILPEQQDTGLDRQTIDKFIGQLEETKPDEFERRDPRLNQLLAGAGQALAQAGQNPTLGEAILATGTGLSQAAAAHDQQQDQLARQREAARRETERAIAEQAFGAEQALVESQRAQEDRDLQRARVAGRLGTQRAKVKQEATQPKELGDGIFTTTDTRTNEDGDLVVEGEIVRGQEQERAFLDQMALGGQEVLKDFELEVNGTDVADLAVGRQPIEKATVIYGGQMAVQEGSLPKDNFEGLGMPETVERIDKMAKERAKKRAQENPDLSLEDATDEERFNLIRTEASRNPVFRASLLKAGGTRVFRPMADRIIEQHNEQVRRQQENQ